MAFECILGTVWVVLVRKELEKNGVLMQESNAKVFYFCVYNPFGLLEFLQGFKVFSFSNFTALS